MNILIESPAANARQRAGMAGEDATSAPPYSYYALFVLVLANFLNYVDRHIVSIIGQRLKDDLSLTDAQLGFLIGTAFAVFYGVVGVAMGRIADALSRTRLMALGLALWSAMTAVGGLATGFAGLAVARLGVGVGEATANPCSHSLLSDYFPARNRSAVLAIYLLGTHLGIAASLIGGGMLLQNWDGICRVFPDGACSVTNWRAAFFLVGAPGLLLAIFVATLREPARPLLPREGSVPALVLREMSAAVPPLTFWNLYAIGGAGAVLRNLMLAAGLAFVGTALTAAVGDWPQWAALGLGTYSVTTWASVLRRRDPALFALTFGSPVFLLTMIGAALTTCILGAVQAWSAPYVMRVLGVSPGEAGLALGVTSAVAAGLSVLIGGILADWWKRRDRRAPIWIILIGLIGPIPAFAMMMQAETLTAYVTGLAIFMLLSMLWAGGVAALVQDLVLPRMRGTAASAFALIMTLVGSGLGPYWAGKISTFSGSLTTGLVSIYALAPIATIFLIAAASRMRSYTPETRLARMGLA